MPLVISTYPKTEDLTLISIVLSYFLHASSFLPEFRMSGMNLNSIGSITIHLNNPDNCEFGSNIGLFIILSPVSTPYLGCNCCLTPQCSFPDLKSLWTKFCWNFSRRPTDNNEQKCIHMRAHTYTHTHTRMHVSLSSTLYHHSYNLDNETQHQRPGGYTSARTWWSIIKTKKRVVH